MKSIVLGIMIASVSVSFAQTDDAPTHQLKRKFSAKQRVEARPATMDLKENRESVVLSRSEVKSDIAFGVIRVKNGTPFIDLNSSLVERRMMPSNLPKGMAIDGQEIQFRYTVSDASSPKQGEGSMVINIYDVSMSPRK
ncbi:MAG: hypothetical protein COA38_01430 [Fluviicola sp.]|nr:MAG: hypothetical protein COA38_01430 [Fluviicola sp.]